MDVTEIMNEFYSNYDEDSRLLSKCGQVEFLTTMRYIEKYLRPGMRVLEIGAATGRYSHTLARKGHSVDAVELVQHNIDIFNDNTQPGENVTIVRGDATHLDGFADETYDITLLLGPMYHLFDDETRSTALSEALRVTKRGGVVFAAYCGNDATVIQFLFGRGMVNDPSYKEMVDEGFRCRDSADEGFAVCRREDIDRLMEQFNAERLHYVGTDMYALYLREMVAGMDDETFARFMDYQYVICERADMVGISNHILDIFRKR